jgi:uncharacterized hydrophobic protein (TIGR00271 family)
MRDRFNPPTGKAGNKAKTKAKGSPQAQQMSSDLLVESTIDSTYLILIVSSCVIATFGLLTNSAAVIIGAMIIAPLMLPIRGLAFGALEGNPALFRRGLVAVAVGTVLAVTLASLLGKLVGIANFGSEVLSRSEPTLLDLGIAIAAGSVSGYAKVQPRISESLAGTAIAVALMPPLCVIGLGLSQSNWTLAQGSTLLYLTNLLGITLSCMLTFLLAGYVPFRHARKALTLVVTFTAILLIPLGLSFARLIQQAHLQASLTEALLNRTVTFQRVELLNTTTNWSANPPEVRLNVRAKEPITPTQVSLLEEFLQDDTGQAFTLIFVVGQVEEIRREGQMTGSTPDSIFENTAKKTVGKAFP